MTERIVILGGGLAGGNAAVTLREEGFTGPVTLVGREPGVPFGRPPLSKTYLRSEEDLDGWYVRPASWYDEHDVERLTAEVTGIDAAAHTLALGSGQELEYASAAAGHWRPAAPAPAARRRTWPACTTCAPRPTARRSSGRPGPAAAPSSWA